MDIKLSQEITRKAEEILKPEFENGTFNDEMSWDEADAEDKESLINALAEEYGIPARAANYFLTDAFETVKRDHNIEDEPEPDPLITDLYDEAFPKNENTMKINENDIKAMVAECVKRIIKEYNN